jgi:hypothetical protein
MHALPGQDGKRTFSSADRDFSGLPGQSTLKAGGQDFTDFNNVFGGRDCFVVWLHELSKPPGFRNV